MLNSEPTPTTENHQYMLWIATIVYLIHMMEETIYGWLEWTRRVFHIDATWPEFAVVNAFVAILGICCAAIGWKKTWVALVFPGLMLTNAIVFHIGAAIVSRTFSPGMITAVLLFLPTGFLCYRAAAVDGVLRRRDVLLSAIVGFLLMCLPAILQATKHRPPFAQPATSAGLSFAINRL